MKIGLIVPAFSRDEADWCIPVLRDFATVLAARGASVHVFPLAYPHERRDYAIGAVQIHATGGRPLGWARDPRLFFRAAGAISREHRRGRFDVLHAVFADECAPVALAAARRLGVPLAVTLAAGELSGLREIGYGCDLSWPRALAVRLALRGATGLIVPCEYMAGLLRRRTRRAHAVLPWGVDTARFHPSREAGPPAGAAAAGPGAVPVLCVAEQMRPVKNTPMLLDSLARAAPGARLVLVGGGRRPLAPPGIVLEWHEKIEWDRLPAVYQAAGLFAQASWHEAFGVAVLEALASGLPVVGTAVGLLAEVASGPLRAGLAVAPGDAAGLAGAFGALLRDPERRATYARNARALAETRYDWQIVAPRFLALYGALAVGGRPI
jgi:glycosyltransferase involved in cell wall biosynthesis